MVNNVVLHDTVINERSSSFNLSWKAAPSTGLALELHRGICSTSGFIQLAKKVWRFSLELLLPEFHSLPFYSLARFVIAIGFMNASHSPAEKEEHERNSLVIPLSLEVPSNGSFWRSVSECVEVEPYRPSANQYSRNSLEVIITKRSFTSRWKRSLEFNQEKVKNLEEGKTKLFAANKEMGSLCPGCFRVPFFSRRPFGTDRIVGSYPLYIL